MDFSQNEYQLDADNVSKLYKLIVTIYEDKFSILREGDVWQW